MKCLGCFYLNFLFEIFTSVMRPGSPFIIKRLNQRKITNYDASRFHTGTGNGSLPSLLFVFFLFVDLDSSSRVSSPGVIYGSGQEWFPVSVSRHRTDRGQLCLSVFLPIGNFILVCHLVFVKHYTVHQEVYELRGDISSLPCVSFRFFPFLLRHSESRLLRSGSVTASGVPESLDTRTLPMWLDLFSRENVVQV